MEKRSFKNYLILICLIVLCGIGAGAFNQAMGWGLFPMIPTRGGRGTNEIAGGTPSQKDTRVGYDAAYACDGSTSGTWAEGGTEFYADWWWQYDFGAGNEKTFTWAGLYGNDYGMKNFKVEGSNNGSDWFVLYTGIMGKTAGWTYFEMTNSTAYRYYRFWCIDGHDPTANVPKVPEVFLSS